MINLGTHPGSLGRGDRRLMSGARERRTGPALACRDDGPPRGRLTIEAALDAWEGRRMVLDHLPDAVFATDADERVTHWTRSAERLFGYSASEAIGRSASELLAFTAAHAEDESARTAALRGGRTWRGAGSVRLRDGHEMWLGTAVEPIMAYGRLVGSVSVSRDITDIHAAQTRLADEERFVSSVLDVIGALVVVLDSQGRITRFNGACERLSGYDSAEVLGRLLWDVVIPPAEVEDVRAVVAALKAGAYPNSHENHWLTRAGALRLISWENTCLTDDQGTVTHVIGTGLDITEARHRHEAMRGLEAVGRLLADQGPVPAALDAVLGEMQARMGYRFLSLYLSDGPDLRLAAQRGYRAIPERLNADAGVVGRVLRTGRGEVVADVTSDLDYLPGDQNVAAEMAIPLTGDGETLGVLNIESARPGAMTEADLQFARTIADRLSSSVRRSQARQALSERTRLFTALSEFAAAVNAIREPEQLVAALVDAVGTVVPSDTVTITTLDRRDGRYRVAAVRGFDSGAIGAIIEPGAGTAGRAISERVLIVREPHPRAESNPALREYMQYESVRTVGVPLINEDTVLGAISVARAQIDAAFTQAECEVFALLGSHAALALANANLIQQVSALAIHDGLTGLYNRRHFDAALDLAVARFKRRGPAGSLAAIMFDLDHFGDFNRRHGHLAGDALLRLFGDILRERLRSADIVARYGGEEFVAILEDCGLAEAVRLADEVREELQARAVPGADGQLLRATVSAGCSIMDAAEPTKEALIGVADAGLFMAKGAGRNRVVAS